MALRYKHGTTQLLKVGTSLAAATACCCTTTTTGRCCHYEPNTPPTASGPLQDVSSWTISDASVATCTDGVTSTSCNGVFAEGASCTGFNCNTSDTTTLATGNCWLWKNTDVQLQLSVGAQFVRDDGGPCISCVSYLPCTYGVFHCSVTDVQYAYAEATYYEIKNTQPAADINISSNTPTATCASGTVVGCDILLHKSKWIKVGQIPCTGAVRDTILAQLQTYDRHYSYLYTYADGVVCNGGSVGYTNVVDTLTYAHPIVTGNNGCTC